MIKIVDCDNFI